MGQGDTEGTRGAPRDTCSSEACGRGWGPAQCAAGSGRSAGCTGPSARCPARAEAQGPGVRMDQAKGVGAHAPRGPGSSLTRRRKGRGTPGAAGQWGRRARRRRELLPVWPSQGPRGGAGRAGSEAHPPATDPSKCAACRGVTVTAAETQHPNLYFFSLTLPFTSRWSKTRQWSPEGGRQGSLKPEKLGRAACFKGHTGLPRRHRKNREERPNRVPLVTLETSSSAVSVLTDGSFTTENVTRLLNYYDSKPGGITHILTVTRLGEDSERGAHSDRFLGKQPVPLGWPLLYFGWLCCPRFF